MICTSLKGKSAGENLLILDFSISNERSSQAILKSKRLGHLVLLVKNASKTSVKHPFRALQSRYFQRMFSILALFQKRLHSLTSVTSHLVENSVSYKWILFERLIYRVKNNLQVKHYQKLKKCTISE